MGEWMKARNCKWGDDTEMKLTAIREKLSPMCASRSHALRWLIEFAYTVICTPGILGRVAAVLQDAGCVFFVRTVSAHKSGNHLKKTVVRAERRKAERRCA